MEYWRQANGLRQEPGISEPEDCERFVAQVSPITKRKLETVRLRQGLSPQETAQKIFDLWPDANRRYAGMHLPVGAEDAEKPLAKFDRPILLSRAKGDIPEVMEKSAFVSPDPSLILIPVPKQITGEVLIEGEYRVVAFLPGLRQTLRTAMFRCTGEKTKARLKSTLATAASFFQ